VARYILPHLTSNTRETDLRNRGCLQAANIDEVSMQMNRTASPLSRTAKVTVALLFIVWLVDYFDRLIMNFALPYIGKEFHLNHTQEGLLISAFFIAYAFSQLPGGVLADKIGTRKIIAIAMIVWSVFTGFTGLAWGFGALLVIRFMFGIGEGVFPGASFKAISERTNPAERMTANGIMLSSNQFGSAVAPLLAAPLIAAIGWRWSFGAAAVAGLACCVAILYFLPPPDTRKPAPEAQAPPVGKTTTWALFKSPIMFVYVVMFFGVDIIGWGVSTWMPSYLLAARGISIGHSAILVAIPNVVAGVGTILGGKLSDLANGRPRLVAAPALAVATAALLLMATSKGLTAFISWECVALFGFGLSFMPCLAVPIKTLNGKFAGSAAGMINFGGQMAGVFAPVIMGALIDRFSYVAAFLFLALGAVIGLIAAVIAPQTPDALAQKLSKNELLRGGFATTEVEKVAEVR